MKTSLQGLWQDARKVIKRFPISMVMALVATIIGILMVRHDASGMGYYMDSFENPIPEAYIRLFKVSILGIFLFAGAKLYDERQKKSSNVTQLLVAVFLVFYYFLLPVTATHFFEELIATSFIYGLTFLFILPTAPFLKQKGEKGYWAYLKTLFIRLFFTFIYTSALFLGVALLLGGLEQLFDIYYNSNIYLQLWLVITLLVGNAYFLLGIPEKVVTTQRAADYPKSVKIFSQFILLPLLSLYTVMLYVYSLKELLQQGRPDTFVIPLVLIFGVAILLMYYLIQPLHWQSKEKWSKRLTTTFLILFLPALAIFGWSLLREFQIYGLNEGIYFAFLISFWLLGSALYLLISHEKKFRHVTASFVLLAIVSSFGPWGSVGLSANYQLVQLNEVLSQNGLIEEGQIIKLENAKVSQEDLQKIENGLRYLIWDVGYSAEALGFSGLSKECMSDSYCLMSQGLGLEYNGYYEYEGNFPQHFFAEHSEIEVAGYSKLLNNIYYYEGNYEVMIEKRRIQVGIESEILTVTVLDDGVEYAFPLTAMLNELEKMEFDFEYKPSTNVSDPSSLVLEVDGAKLIIESLAVRNVDVLEDRTVEDLRASLLIE